MLTLTTHYSRLEIPASARYADVSEELIALFPVCHLNPSLQGLIVSRQASAIWQGTMLAAFGTAASRGLRPKCRLAVVVSEAAPGVITLTHFAAERMRASPRVGVWLNRLAGTMLVGFGVKLAVGK